jgi:very-long-chain enoyl-CoA reductase
LVGKPIKALPKEIQVSPDASAQEIHSRLATASKFDINRLRITKSSDRGVVPNAKNTTVNDAGLQNQSVIQVKDLGAWNIGIGPNAFQRLF